jgi:hypothetical protein
MLIFYFQYKMLYIISRKDAHKLMIYNRNLIYNLLYIFNLYPSVLSKGLKKLYICKHLKLVYIMIFFISYTSIHSYQQNLLQFFMEIKLEMKVKKTADRLSKWLFVL